MFLLTAAVPLPNLAQAPSRTIWSFRCSERVRWGGAVLPVGDYVFSVSADQPPVVTVYQRSSGFTAKIAAQTVTSAPANGSTRIFTVHSGNGNYISSVYVNDIHSTLTFAPPDVESAEPNPKPKDSPREGPDAVKSAAEEDGFLTIHSSQRQPAPYFEAKAIYLSACKVVEQEFSRTDPVRPRLTLILGASSDGVNFPKREIQLTKWNKYEFAQGVVLLAADELLPLAKRMSLTQLAVLEADSTIDISDLKSGRMPAHLPPQN